MGLTKEQKKTKLEEIRGKLIAHINNFVENTDGQKIWIHEDGDMLFVDWYACISFENDELTISFDLDCIPFAVANIMYSLCQNKIELTIYNDYYYSVHDHETYFDEEAFARRFIDMEIEIMSSKNPSLSAIKVRQAMNKMNKKLN